MQNKLIKNLLVKFYIKILQISKEEKLKQNKKMKLIGSTSKIYAQKGTGNARHASRKAPIFVGGGVAHGPKGQNAYKI